jgi:hypothetical protein
MGMFDGQGMNQAPSSLADMYRGVGRSIGKGFLDPYMESKGFISQENQILEVMKDVDLNDPASYSEGFRKIMEINPQAAAEFRAQTMPLLQANLEAQSLNLEQQRLDAAAASALQTKGTPENQALAVLKSDLIEKHGQLEGSRLFLEKKQQMDEDVASAGVTKKIGVDLFESTLKSRDEGQAKLSQINTSIKLFQQAKGGDVSAAAAAKLSESVITNVFEGSSTKAASEIQRIASAGSLVENIGDFVNEALTGVKTQEHYNAFLKVLEIYKKEQETLYNNKTEVLKGLNDEYDLKVPSNQFDMKETQKVLVWDGTKLVEKG